MERCSRTLCLVAATCLSVVVAACAVSQQIPRTTVVAVLDFTPYSQQGFMFTPATYHGDFESIGLVTVTVYPECNFSTDSSEEVWERACEEIDPQDGLDTMYHKAKDMGADAVTNVQVRTVSVTVKRVRVDGIEVSGFAIRRR